MSFFDRKGTSQGSEPTGPSWQEVSGTWKKKGLKKATGFDSSIEVECSNIFETLEEWGDLGVSNPIQ